MEKDIRKIIKSFVNESEVCDGIKVDELSDIDALAIEISEYINNNYEIKKQ